MVFRRSSSDDAAAKAGAAATPGADEAPDPKATKGRPTPSRREAEAARKQSLKIPSDPKAARKAARERDRQARAEQRAGLLAGDERSLPPRDQGPVRAFVRDFIDSRRTLAEYFVFIALGVLLLGFVQNPQLQVAVSLTWFAMTALIILDTVYLMWRLQRALKQQWPDKADRKGTTFYAVLRCLQIRRLRLPPPKVKAGGKPVAPKKPRR